MRDGATAYVGGIKNMSQTLAENLEDKLVGEIIT